MTRRSGTSIRGEHPARSNNLKLRRALFCSARFTIRKMRCRASGSKQRLSPTTTFEPGRLRGDHSHASAWTNYAGGSVDRVAMNADCTRYGADRASSIEQSEEFFFLLIRVLFASRCNTFQQVLQRLLECKVPWLASIVAHRRMRRQGQGSGSSRFATEWSGPPGPSCSSPTDESAVGSSSVGRRRGVPPTCLRATFARRALCTSPGSPL